MSHEAVQPSPSEEHNSRKQAEGSVHKLPGSGVLLLEDAAPPGPHPAGEAPISSATSAPPPPPLHGQLSCKPARTAARAVFWTVEICELWGSKRPRLGREGPVITQACEARARGRTASEPRQGQSSPRGKSQVSARL